MDLTRRGARTTAVIALALGLASLGGCMLTVVSGSGLLRTEARDVASFTAIDLRAVGDAVVEVGPTASVEIDAEDNLLPYLTTSVVDGTLRIETKAGVTLRTTKAILYRITVPTLTRTSVAGSGTVHAEGIQGTDFAADVSGSGQIVVKGTAQTAALDVSGSGRVDTTALASDALTVDVSGSGHVAARATGSLSASVGGSGDISVSGTAQQCRINVAGSGSVDARSMTSTNADVTISGSGAARVNVTGELSVHIQGSGDVTYQGAPNVTSDIQGSGRVRQG
jgi:hypothetical protein